jgi:flagellar export protein FliJ
MRAFKFRLDQVLRWRESQAHEAEERLRIAVAEVQRAAIDLAAVKQERTSALQTGLGRDVLTGLELEQLSRYSAYLGRRAHDLGDRLVSCQRVAESQRRQYLEAQRRCKILETLKATKQHAWKAEEQHEWELLASESYLAQWNASPEHHLYEQDRPS